MTAEQYQEILMDWDGLVEDVRTMVNESKESEPIRGDGGSTNYYKLPIGSTELKDLIRHKQMNHSIGEAFSALYRLNDNGEKIRNLRKALYYIQDELNYLEKVNESR